MRKDQERNDRICAALRRAGLDAILCTLPSNVLLLTGYWPVVGSSIAIATASGEVALIAPQDEQEYVEGCGADRIVYFTGGPVTVLTSLVDDVRPHLTALLKTLGLVNKTIGLETGPVSEQVSYVAMTLYLDATLELLKEASPFFIHKPADELLAREKASLTTREVEQVRLACAVAARAYAAGRENLTVRLADAASDVTEIEASQYFEVPLSTYAIALDTASRAGGKVSCMSGLRSGSAYGAYAMSSRAPLPTSENASSFALTHCNSQVNGYWTDITRTYHLGEPSERALRMYQTLLRAREAGLAEVRPTVRAHDIDEAVRSVLRDEGFGDAFKHGTGHGVGFAAINHRALPRIRPNSPDILEAGMIFNIEPGIYFEDYGGMRHCDMVLVTESGAELLTPFHAALTDLVLV